jgi:Tol biopolymer transport system component
MEGNVKRIIICGCIVVLTLASLAADDKKASVLFQAAQAKETVQGDLKGAIDLYQQAVKEAGSNRALAAQALAHEADCYRRLGDEQARGIYEQLVRDYADQTEAVAVARSFLDGAGVAKKDGLISRRMWTVSECGCDVFGNVSPDGRYVPYIDYGVGLMLHDLTTGANRRLTADNEGDVDASLTGAYSFSRDGKQLAYSWDNYRTNRREIRVVNLQEPGVPASRRLVNNAEITVIRPHDWSPDGRWIAVTVGRADRSAQIGLVSTADGSLHVLKSIDWRFPSHLFFSPDGKYLAFDFQDDVFILVIDGSGKTPVVGREIPAVVESSHDLMAGWSPDGTRLLFTSDRAGSSNGLWALHFTAGEVQGPPELITRDLGESITTAGVTATGGMFSVVYPGKVQNGRSQDILQAGFDFALGKFMAPPVLAVPTFVETNRQPHWSPDGKYLAYLSRDFMIGIRSAATGELVRELSLYQEMAYLLSFSWASDGASFIVVGTDAKGRSGIFRLNQQTLRTTPIVLPESGSRGDVNPAVESPDGKSLYHRLRAPRTNTLSPPAFVSFVKRNLMSGTTTEIIRRPNLGGLNLSPDGRFIATSYNESSKVTSILVAPTGGGEPRELMRDQPPLGIFTWAPDSRSLFVRKGTETWRAPIDGGQPSKLDVTLDPTWAAFDVHPDGRQIAIQTDARGKPPELWVLENFLPPANAKK